MMMMMFVIPAKSSPISPWHCWKYMYVMLIPPQQRSKIKPLTLKSLYLTTHPIWKLRHAVFSVNWITLQDWLPTSNWRQEALVIEWTWWSTRPPACCNHHFIMNWVSHRSAVQFMSPQYHTFGQSSIVHQGAGRHQAAGVEHMELTRVKTSLAHLQSRRQLSTLMS